MILSDIQEDEDVRHGYEGKILVRSMSPIVLNNFCLVLLFFLFLSCFVFWTVQRDLVFLSCVLCRRKPESVDYEKGEVELLGVFFVLVFRKVRVGLGKTSQR